VISIDDFNSQVGKIYNLNSHLLKYSPAFCRCEGQSKSYLRISNNINYKNIFFFYAIIFLIIKIIRDILLSFTASKINILEKINNDSIIVFSYFDHRNNNNGVLREEYFRKILENNKDVICLYKLTTPGFYKRGKKYINLIERLEKNFSAYSENHLVNLKMIFEAIILNIIHFFKFLSIKIPKNTDYQIVKTLKRTHYKEIIDGTVYTLYLQNRIFTKILKNKPNQILSVWENQPWVRVLESLKKEISPSTTSKGFQHTGFSKKLLQHYPSKYEMNLDTYPDYIITNGEINKNELIENTNLPSKIILGGALRQDHLLIENFKKIKKLSYDSILNIAYAFSWEQEGYEKIINDLYDLPDEINVYLKFHPLYPDWIRRKDFPDRFINTQLSWFEIAKKCDLVLVNDNSLMFEGYYYGMSTAIYDGADIFNLEKRDFDSPICHLKKEDLKKLTSSEIIEKINNSTQKVINTKYLEKYFFQQDIKYLKYIFLDKI
tara:strand:- start:5555 stop:7027 length:1473 start_codon:yes stop_codon:yes gene_type:complete